MAGSETHGAKLLPLTFGVELEMLFALNKQKVTADPTFDYLFPQYYELDPQDQVDDRGKFDPTRHANRGLCQAATILRGRGVDLAIKVNPKQDDNLFHRWSLTIEEAVEFPETNFEMAAVTNDVFPRRQGFEFTGLELISPILKAPDMQAQEDLQGGSFNELDGVLEAVYDVPTEEPYIFVSRPETSSVHVHVGLEPDEDWGPVDIPIKVLQHLAWLVAVFEDAITLLHHPERHGYSGTKIHEHACSNRRAFADWADGGFPVPEKYHICDTAQSAFNPLKAFKQIFTATDHVKLRAALSNEPSVNNLGFRNTFVNFTNIASGRGEREPFKTVEFRQHCGTGDAIEIKEWIYFVSSLFRAAERKANQDFEVTSPPHDTDVCSPIDLDLERAKYKNLFSKRQRTFRELFDLMELPVERRRYWWERVQVFRSEDYAPYMGGNLCLPDCNGKVIRDCEGWEAGEIIEQPWGPLLSPPHSPPGPSSADTDDNSCQVTVAHGADVFHWTNDLCRSYEVKIQRDDPMDLD